MNHDEILRIVGDHLGVPASILSLDKHLVKDLGADSLDLLELLMTIEEYLGIRLDHASVPERIGDIVAMLESSNVASSNDVELRKP